MVTPTSQGLTASGFNGPMYVAGAAGSGEAWEALQRERALAEAALGRTGGDATEKLSIN